jgi:hypothetical protein
VPEIDKGKPLIRLGQKGMESGVPTLICSVM